MTTYITKGLLLFLGIIVMLSIACTQKDEEIKTDDKKVSEMDEGFARINNVSTSGTEGNYNFSVTVESPDTGCDQYADWWEVVSSDGQLIYRRILAHSHVGEQPFSRSGGLVNVSKNDKIWVRSHMNNNGYGTQAFFGSIEEGFQSMDTKKDFASSVENDEPQPGKCAF